MIEKIDHLGIAVQDLEAVVAIYRDALGLHLEKIEEVPTEQVRVAMFRVGESEIELLQPTSPDGPIARFLEKRGEGIHHVALRVDDIEAAMAQARQGGLQLLSDAPRPGAGGSRVAFCHPRSTRGVLIEFVQYDKENQHR